MGFVMPLTKYSNGKAIPRHRHESVPEWNATGLGAALSPRFIVEIHTAMVIKALHLLP